MTLPSSPSADIPCLNTLCPGFIGLSCGKQRELRLDNTFNNKLKMAGRTERESSIATESCTGVADLAEQRRLNPGRHGETETQFKLCHKILSQLKNRLSLVPLQVRHGENVLWRGLKRGFLGQGIPGTIEESSHYPKQGLCECTCKINAESRGFSSTTLAPKPPPSQAGAWKRQMVWMHKTENRWGSL